jgi:3-hydroxyisobutyrate dehydrogenase
MEATPRGHSPAAAEASRPDHVDGQLRIGFIGLGDMGGRMARRIVDAGFALTVHDVRAVASRDLSDRGARVAAGVTEVATASDVVCICVVTDEQLCEVVHRIQGDLAPGSVVLVHSSVAPQTIRAIATELDSRNVTVVDAPVSGSRPAAEAGTLTVLTAGDRDVVESLRPLLQTFASNIIHAGAVGSGQALKIANNMMLHMNHLIALEAVWFARSQGISEDVLIEAVNVSSGRSWVTETWGLLDAMIVDHPLAGTAGFYPLMSKEMWHSVEIGRQEMTALPLTALGTQLSQGYFREREQDLAARDGQGDTLAGEGATD